MKQDVKHIFLTGEKQVGKSTALGKVLETLCEQGYRVGGFQTLPFSIHNKRRGFYMHSLMERENDVNDIPIALCFHTANGMRRMGITETFDCFGADLLREALTDADIIWMDELGRLEKEATQFNQAVVECLNRGKHIVGVLQKTNREFLQEIASREDVMVLEVTIENRNEIAKKVLEALGEML
ncbi:nucleoside-triphosphatase [Eubacterium oxidoreducens]|uniref:Nucleoside-triphosphatase n=1 Tax=Eubacterium oxidoreducens TaxID=1732 RepID=A0A1G6CIM3_EUBOX|nr:nucleoside-triphosphatase [Eubacterium oxidoreducens]SDB32778.1 nucleoside-triphosphatase [Eubacterium oxidoreducens]